MRKRSKPHPTKPRKVRKSTTRARNPGDSAPAKATAKPKKPRRRRDPFSREWVLLKDEARALDFDWRTIRDHVEQYIKDHPTDCDLFVLKLGDRLYVRHQEFLAWLERQRLTPERVPVRSPLKRIGSQG